MQKCLQLPMGGYAVHVQGVSELVRYHQAIFLTPLEKVEALSPENTQLVSDTTPEYRQTRLYLETLLRRMPPTDPQIHIGHRGALDVMPYQLVPAKQGLEALRPRLLIADGTGLGKTVELGILLSELVRRGRGRRILVVAIRSMLAQLQRELWARFTLPLVRLDSEGLLRVQNKIPANRNPFGYFDRCIISVDTLKNDALYRAWLEQIRWDVIVVDECHNVAGTTSQRAELARLLSTQCDALVMTSATPHNGRPESFANLMNMLDPTSIADPTSFTKEDVKHLFVRRFKKDVEGEARAELQDREVKTVEAEGSPAEEAAFAAVHALRLHGLGRKRSGEDALLRWTLVKALGSSPAACAESIEARIRTTEQALTEGDGPHPFATDLEKDLSGLRSALELVNRAEAPGAFAKLERLTEELKALGFDGSPKSPRVVIFSERIRTLALLEKELVERFRVPEKALAVFTAGTGDDEEQREIIESFGRKESPLRLLLCSDAASEGINLHHQCHHLFHFDVPWSLIRLTQRNGRIDRYGQHHRPRLFYLTTRTRQSTADQRVVARLIEKEREVERQLGDAGALLGLYVAEDEDDALTRGVARGLTAEALIPDEPARPAAAQAALSDARATPAPAMSTEAEPPTEGPVDLLALMAEVEAEQAKTPTLDALTAQSPSLFASDWDFVTAALRHLERSPVVGTEPLEWKASADERTLELVAPEPFRRHVEPFLPREALPGPNAPYRLVEGRAMVQEKLRAALDDEGRWPDWHLLWEQHPLVDWVLDALASAYARLEAPLLRVPGLGGSAVFLLQGLLYNHESEAVTAEWLGLELNGGKFVEAHLDLEAVRQRVGLDRALVNPGPGSTKHPELQERVPEAIQLARGRLLTLRQERVSGDVSTRARKETRRLERWQAESLARIERKRATWSARGATVPRHVERRLADEIEAVKRIRENHDQLLKSLSVNPDSDPFIRLAAVFTGA